MLYATDQDILCPTLAWFTFTSTLSFMDVIIRSHHEETMMAVANSTRLYIHKNRKQDVWLPRPPGAIKSQEIQHQELTEQVAKKQEKKSVSKNCHYHETTSWLPQNLTTILPF